ncbi:MAG: TIGR00341 family protein [Paludibacteraceae bacterium]
MKWNWNRNAVVRYLRRLTALSNDIDTQAAMASIRKNVYFRGPNVFILFFAIIVASVGLNVNSIPVIIGAMLISPLMGPIMGFGMGLGINDTDLIRTSLKNLTVMVSISILASTLYFVVSPLSMENPTELLARTKPTIYDVFIALFGGFAGILETSRKERGTVLSGVAIATALMPPLCTVGYGIASLSWQYAVGALYLFLINSILIALATFLTVKYLHYPVLQEETSNKKRRAISITLVVLILIVPSVISAISVIRENNFSHKANLFIAQHKLIGTSYVYQTAVSPSASTIDFYLAGETLSEGDRKLFMAEAAKAGFDSSSIILHEDVLIPDNTGLREDQLIKDLFATKEEQIQAYQQQINDLRAQLEAAEKLNTQHTFPTEQLTRELQAQYPSVASVSFASGEHLIRTDSTSHVQSLTLVSIHLSNKKGLSKSERGKLEAWLKIRLNANDMEVIIQ